MDFIFLSYNDYNDRYGKIKRQYKGDIICENVFIRIIFIESAM